MKRKFLLFLMITLVLFGGVFGVYWKFVRQGSYMVFIESFDHGVMTVESDNTTGTDEKYRVVCKKGEEITVNINPERTDSTYYNLAKLTVNGEDVTDDVDMLQYKTTVEKKLTILAYFKKGKRPEGTESSSTSVKIEKPNLINPADDPYIGSYGAYDIKDPSVIYDEASGYYYCFGSDNVVVKSTDMLNWGGRTTYFKHPENAQNNAVMSFSAFESVQQWAKSHGYGEDEIYSDYNQDRTPLAPDIIKIGDTYYLYFSLSKTADANESAIFCVKTNNLQEAIEEKKWEDVGLVISTCGRHAGIQTTTDADGNKNKTSVKAYYDEANAVHPNVIVTDNGIFMSYGASYGRENIKGAIYLVEISSKTGLLKEASRYNAEGETVSTLHGPERFKAGVLIANPGRIPALSKKDGSLISGSEIYYNSKNGYYYLFVTYGVEGSNYNVRVARSKSISGPYTDIEGNSMSDYGKKAKDNQYTKGLMLIGGYTFNASSNGSVLYSNIGRASVGSPCVINTRDGKQMLALQSQLYFKDGADITTGIVRAEEKGLGVKAAPSLDMRQLRWTEEGWPMVAPETYSGVYMKTGIKENQLYGNWDVIIFDENGNSEDYTAVERNESFKLFLNKKAVITARDIAKERDLNTEGLLKANKGYYTLTVDGVEYKIYSCAMWDNELQDGSIFFTGIGNDGSTIWAKKNYSDTLGIYTDAFYHVLSMCDDATRAKYEKKIKKISANPSQYEIDTMTSKLISVVVAAQSEKK